MELIQLKKIIEKLIENGTDIHADIVNADCMMLQAVFVSTNYGDDDVESTEIELRFN